MTDQVIAGVDGVAEATPASGEVAQVATPTPQPNDVEMLKAEYEGKLAKYQEDLNRMKSTFQRREADIAQRAAQEAEAKLQDRLHQLEIRGMDETERAKYEAERRAEALENLQRENQALKAAVAKRQAISEAVEFFRAKGAPIEKLNTSSYNELIESGWKWVDERLSGIPAQPQEVKKPPQAPSTALSNGATVSSKPTWEDLVKRYGSVDIVFELVESGQLSPDIIPLT